MTASKSLLNETKCEVTDLIQGSTYEFRVIAENKIGKSSPSEASESVLVKDPWGKPVNYIKSGIKRIY